MKYFITPKKHKWIYILMEWANVCSVLTMNEYYLIRDLVWGDEAHYNEEVRDVLNKAGGLLTKYQVDSTSVRVSNENAGGFSLAKARKDYKGK
jgi:hypothetical protein